MICETTLPDAMFSACLNSTALILTRMSSEPRIRRSDLIRVAGVAGEPASDLAEGCETIAYYIISEGRRTHHLTAVYWVRPEGSADVTIRTDRYRLSSESCERFIWETDADRVWRWDLAVSRFKSA